MIAWGFSASTLRPRSEMRTRPVVGFSSRPAYFRCVLAQPTRLLKMLCCPLGRTSLRSCSVSPKRPASRSVSSRMSPLLTVGEGLDQRQHDGLEVGDGHGFEAWIGPEDNQEEVTFKVADRRKFNADGSVREGVTIEPAKPVEKPARTASGSETGSGRAAAPEPARGTSW